MPEVVDEIREWMESVEPVTLAEVQRASKPKQPLGVLAFAAVCAILVGLAGLVLVTQIPREELNESIASPGGELGTVGEHTSAHIDQFGSAVKLPFAIGGQVEISLAEKLLGRVQVELVPMPEEYELGVSFALHLTNPTDVSVFVNDFRRSVKLDEAGQITIFDSSCGPEGFCSRLFQTAEIRPGDSLDLQLFVYLQEPLDAEASHEFTRAVQISNAPFRHPTDRNVEINDYDLELVMKFVPEDIVSAN